jgi:hypothetical protein
VRSSRRPAGDHCTLFGELVFYGNLKVGEGGAISGDVPLYALKTVHVVGEARVVQSVVESKELISFVEVSAAEDLSQPPADKDLVFLGREHCLSCWRS